MVEILLMKRIVSLSSCIPLRHALTLKKIPPKLQTAAEYLHGVQDLPLQSLSLLRVSRHRNASIEGSICSLPHSSSPRMHHSASIQRSHK